MRGAQGRLIRPHPTAFFAAGAVKAPLHCTASGETDGLRDSPALLALDAATLLLFVAGAAVFVGRFLEDIRVARHFHVDAATLFLAVHLLHLLGLL